MQMCRIDFKPLVQLCVTTWGAAALNSEYAARAQRNKELEAARKERLEQRRTRKLERGEDRKWSVEDIVAAQEFQATQAQAGRDFQAQQEDQQQHAVRRKTRRN